MATGGVRRPYKEDDKVDEYLLNQVSKLVLYDRLGLLARDLGITQAELSRIRGAKSQPEEQIFQVLYRWYTKNTLTIKDLIAQMLIWQTERYLDRDVWSHLQSKIDPAALPGDVYTLQLPAPSSGPNPMVHPCDLRPGDQDNSQTPYIVEMPSESSESSEGSAPKRTELPSQYESEEVPGELHQEEFGSSCRSFDTKTYTSLRRRLKLALRRRCRNFLSTDWLPVEKARNFPLRQHYVEGNWTKKIKKARRDTKHKMEKINDIFENNYGEGAVNVLAIGEAGTGKSCCMAMLSSDWSETSVGETSSIENQLDQFDYVFFIELRYVDDNSSLERIIIKQHGLQGVKEHELSPVLREEASGKVLLLLDGYDEYKKGTNEDIDAAIEDTLGNCFLILTSRDGDHISNETRKKFDGEIEITGLSHHSIMQYTGKYFESEEIAGDLYEKAKEAGIVELLRLPIILLMVCILYDEKQQLPKSQTDIVSSIIDMLIDRSALKHFGMKAKDIVGLEQMLYKLGELAWTALRRDTQQLLLSKSEVELVGAELLRLGIIHESPYNEKTALTSRTDWLTFPHKLFQEYWAGYYASKRLSAGPSKSEISEIFVLPDDMEQHWNVIKFTCGLMENSSVLIERICEELVHILTTMTLDPEHEKSFLFLYNHGYLRDLDRERSPASCNPYSNRIICCMNERYSRIQKYSELYYFYGADVFEHYVDCTETPLQMETRSNVNASAKPCSIVIRETSSPLFIRSVLQACSEIKQPVKYLIVEGSAMNTIGQEMYFPHTKLYEVQDYLPMISFLSQAVVQFSHCNFGSDNLRLMVDSLQCCTSLGMLELLYCRKIPETLISCLTKQKNLSRLVIREYHGKGLSPDVQRKLEQSVRFLRELEHLEIHHMYLDPSLLRASSLRVVSLGDCSLSRTDAFTILQILVKCPIEKLELDSNEIQGAFEDLSRKNVYIFYPHLLTLHLENIDFFEGDIQTIARMINHGKLPVIQNILLDDPSLLRSKLRAHLDVHITQKNIPAKKRHSKEIVNFVHKRPRDTTNIPKCTPLEIHDVKESTRLCPIKSLKVATNESDMATHTGDQHSNLTTTPTRRRHPKETTESVGTPTGPKSGAAMSAQHVSDSSRRNTTLMPVGATPAVSTPSAPTSSANQAQKRPTGANSSGATWQSIFISTSFRNLGRPYRRQFSNSPDWFLMVLLLIIILLMYILPPVVLWLIRSFLTIRHIFDTYF